MDAVHGLPVGQLRSGGWCTESELLNAPMSPITIDTDTRHCLAGNCSLCCWNCVHLILLKQLLYSVLITSFSVQH